MNYNTPLVYLAEHTVLETERLILRPMTMADLEDYHEYTSDADLLKYDYPAHKSLDESRFIAWLFGTSASPWDVTALSSRARAS